MSRHAWLEPWQAACGEAGISLEAAPDREPARVFRVAGEDWGRIARVSRDLECRWSGAWAAQVPDGFQVNALLEHDGGYLLLRATVPGEAPDLPSQTRVYPAADRPERHMQDMFGLRFKGHPDPRRWTRHQAWPADAFPLRRDFSATPPKRTPGDPEYPFFHAFGASVCEVPVGPVHAGIIEPGHFRFQIVGEEVLNLEERLGYVHKGIEKAGEGRDAPGLARLAGRVSGDSCVAHAWAACQAMERAAGLEVPKRGLYMRAILLERERVANHLGDVGAICNDVGFAFAQYQFTRLREDWLRGSLAAFGHRLMMDCVVPGGVTRDLDPNPSWAMADHCSSVGAEVQELVGILERNDSLEDRLMTTGRLTPEMARALGAVGYVGRASGQPFDVRRDAPHAPYDRFNVHVSRYRAGDVAARARLRADEIAVSVALIRNLLSHLPEGPVKTDWTPPPAGAEGLGSVEGWRGETLAYVSFAEEGRVARYFPRDPSWLNWPALERLIHGNIVPDFPVCNKSVNGSYSGHDL